MGHWVRGVDIKLPEFEDTIADDFQVVDLRKEQACIDALQDIDWVFHLSADMGGIGFITKDHAAVAKNNVLMTAHLLESAIKNTISRFFYSSSACIYPMYKQREADVTPLKETDAYPAEPEEGYGLEKLFSEKLCKYYSEDYGLSVRIARFHNVYGPLGTYKGGREKAPAAICRKISLAEEKDSIEVWGDGLQTRSFMYIDDCVEGIYRIMNSQYSLPLNLGNDQLLTVNELVDIIAKIANKQITKIYDTTKPEGVRGRNSDNSLITQVLNWTPRINIEEGLRITYNWIHSRITHETINTNR